MYAKTPHEYTNRTRNKTSIWPKPNGMKKQQQQIKLQRKNNNNNKNSNILSVFNRAWFNQLYLY